MQCGSVLLVMVLLITMTSKVYIALAKLHKRVNQSPVSWQHRWPIVLAWVLLLHHHEVRHVGCASEGTLRELIRRSCVSLSASSTTSKRKVVCYISRRLNSSRTVSSVVLPEIHRLINLLGGRFTSTSLFTISLLLHLVIEL